MTVLNDIVNDITSLIKRVGRLEVQNNPRWVYLAAPLTSTSWDGDAKNNTTDRAIIDLSSVFSVPAGVKAVLARLEHTDATVGAYACLGPSATYAACLVTITQVANVAMTCTSKVPCDANGDIYFYDSEALDAVKIEIWGYYV